MLAFDLFDDLFTESIEVARIARGGDAFVDSDLRILQFVPAFTTSVLIGL
jgi:hypothetical protein